MVGVAARETSRRDRKEHTTAQERTYGEPTNSDLHTYTIGDRGRS